MAESPETSGAVRGLQRFEGFADALFAIAITLLVVELPTPGTLGGPAEPDGLLAALAAEWQAFLALFISFWVIGVYWLHHHFAGRVYVRSDHLFSVLNLVFLFGVIFAPYPVRLWAEHLGQAADEQTAARTLAWALLVPALGWLAAWLYGAHDRRLIDPRLTDGYVRRLTLQYGLSAAGLAIGAVTALFAPTSGLAISLVLTAAYILPPPPLRYVSDEAEQDAEEEAGATRKAEG